MSLPTETLTADQLWMAIDQEPPSEGEMSPIEPGPLGIKPSGGLWTSTYTPEAEYDSDWLRWCSSKGMMAGSHAYRLEIVGEPEVIVVDSLEDLVAVKDEYETKHRKIDGEYQYIEEWGQDAINFVEMAEDFDGMRLTAEGQVETRLTPSHCPDLYGWDSESTVWFDWLFEVAEYVGQYETEEQLWMSG